MNLYNSNVLQNEFGYLDFRFYNVRQISYSNYDNEALKDALAFVDVPWVNVTPMMFRKHFEVFPFFSNFAFFVYTPALIRCSLQDFGMTHLCVEVFLNTLIEHHDLQVLNAINLEKWRQFSNAHLKIIVSWIKDFNDDFSDFLIRDKINEFLERLDRLTHQAGEFEKRWGHS